MGCVYSTPQRPLFRRSEEGSNSNGTNTLSNTNGAANGVNCGPGGSKIFYVINVDDRGNEINHGQIEISENDLILHQRNKNSIVWPLRSLRRYGFDAELFSFECGRRCSTGPGIYAFKCVHAEQLFNVLQESLQHCSNIISPNNHITSPKHATNQEMNTATISSPVIPTTPGPPELAARAPVPVPPPPLLPSSPPHSYVNDIRSYINSPFYANTAVLNGTLVGLPVSSTSHVNISKGRAGSARSASDINTNYAKLDDLVDYVNIDTAVAQYQTGTSLEHTAVIPTANCVSSNHTTSNTNQLTNFETNECSSSKQRTSLICEEIKLSNVSSTTTTAITTTNTITTTTTAITSIIDNSITNTTANDDSNSSTNVKPPILPIKPLSALAASCPPPSSSSKTTTASSIQGSSSSHSQQPESLISPKVPRKSESGNSDTFELNEMVEPVNYITLDLENTNTINNNNGPTYVTTGPATPIFKTPEEGSFILPGTTPPSTPTSIKSISSNYPPQSYATIDFDKTLALSHSAASHRKF